MIILYSLLVFLLFAQSSAEVFSAVDELESLTSQGGQLVEEYRSLIKSLEEAVTHFKRKVNNIEKENVLMRKDPSNYITSPLNAFLLVKYFSYDISKARSRILGIYDELGRRMERLRITDEDFQGAVEGLVRLQEMYDLDPKDLARGIIQDKKYRDDLQAEDLYAIGEDLLFSNKSSFSLSYLELALKKNEETKEMPAVRILERIQECQYRLGNLEKVIETIDEMLKLEPNSQELEDLKLKIELEQLFAEEKKPKENETKSNTVSDGKYTPAKEFALVSKACRGKAYRGPKELSKLFCRYVSKSFFSKVAPFKVEEVNLHPYIAVFYDVITDSESKVFKSFSKHNLTRAQVRNLDTTSRIAKLRVAKLSWHNDDADEIFSRLSNRVGDMAGINMKSAEGWQTQNYGIGGHYDAHHDFFQKGQLEPKRENGNRIATALFYLTDVEKGGATVFPYINITVLPKKGSAVFWWNLSTSGEPEWYTRHSGCPVLVGSKWVANKWIREYGQERTRPCELKPAPTDENYYVKFF